MTKPDIQQQLNAYLADVHSIEEQALTQLRRAPEIAGEAPLAGVFARHLGETEGQEKRVRERLAARGAEPSRLKDAAGRAGGLGMATFAALNPDSPGKLTAHAYSYEHLEVAAYELLRHVAARAGDQEAVGIADAILPDERAAAERFEASFEPAIAAALPAGSPAS